VTNKKDLKTLIPELQSVASCLQKDERGQGKKIS
jgi:hypothetical protein